MATYGQSYIYQVLRGQYPFVSADITSGHNYLYFGHLGQNYCWRKFLPQPFLKFEYFHGVFKNFGQINLDKKCVPLKSIKLGHFHSKINLETILPILLLFQPDCLC